MTVSQEIDVVAGNLIFEWHASHHFPVNSTFERLGGRGKAWAPFDFFHINSIDNDPQGNYLISARHTHTISTIDRLSVTVLWTLGGKLNEFTDNSHGAATNFSWQHDPRWHQNSILTLFDNAASSNENLTVQSRAMVLQMDVPTRQVTLRSSYFHPQTMKSLSQGNVQVLESSSNLFVGWGHSAVFTEFHPNGTLLCDVHFGASAFFTFGRVVSYRDFKDSWIGRPLTEPVAKFLRDNVFVSWNGATEVFSWCLEARVGQSLDQATFQSIGQFEKYGFETKTPIPENILSPYFRLAALDSQGEVLGITHILEKTPTSSNGDFPVLYYWILTTITISGVGFLLIWVLRSRLSRWHPYSDTYC